MKLNAESVGTGATALLLVGSLANEVPGLFQGNRGGSEIPNHELVLPEEDHFEVHRRLNAFLATLTSESRAACEKILDTKPLEAIHPESARIMHEAFLGFRLALMEKMQNSGVGTEEDLKLQSDIFTTITNQTDARTPDNIAVLNALYGPPKAMDTCEQGLRATRVAAKTDPQIAGLMN